MEILEQWRSSSKLWVTAGPGAIAYGAPEAADFTKHSPKMDVYSYGVLMLEVLAKTAHPFQMVDALKA